MKSLVAGITKAIAAAAEAAANPRLLRLGRTVTNKSKNPMENQTTAPR